MSVQEIRSLLTQKGLRPTQQRIAVYDFLLRHPIHPTAETIYRELGSQYPSFSRATVYNSLNRLADVGLVKVLTIDAEEQRFDATVADHGHFQCSACGRVYDFPVDYAAALAEFPQELQLGSRELFCTGLCPDCRAAEK